MRSYVYGDTGTDLVVAIVRADGTPWDMTGATAIGLEWKEVGGERSGSINGSILGTATAGEVIFEDFGNAAAPSAGRKRLVLECRVKWTQSAETYYSLQSLRREIVRFP